MEKRYFDWEKYSNDSIDVLEKLHSEWVEKGTNCESACNQLQLKLDELVKNVETKKTISPHSKPWMNRDLSSLVDDLREHKRRFARHRSERNSLLLEKKREEVCAVARYV